MAYSHRRTTYWALSCFFLLTLFVTSSTAQSSCNPTNCVAQCQPSCSSKEVCVLSTMSNCGQCPASKCMSRAALGLSDDSDNNNSNDGNGDDNNAGLIGGLVGGLIGGGLLIGGLAFCINRYRKRSATASLPIVFQANSRHHQQQQYSMNTGGYSNDGNAYPRPMSESTRDSACHSITSGVIPIAYIPPSHHMQQEIYQQQQQYHTTTTSTSPQHSIKTAQPVATPTTMTSHSTTTTAVENPFQDPRHSQYTVNDEEDDDDDDDMSSRHHSVISTGQQASHHAVQVTRAKPQILRVNTVRVNDLKRGGSVRTILTKSDEEPTALSRSNTIDVVPVDSAGNDKSAVDGNPFQDDRFAVVDHTDDDDDDDDDLRPSRPTTNHSLGSTMGDGEITIFWSGQQPLASHSNQPH